MKKKIQKFTKKVKLIKLKIIFKINKFNKIKMKQDKNADIKLSKTNQIIR